MEQFFRWQNMCDWKIEICVRDVWKHCGERGNSIFLFQQCFQKASFWRSLEVGMIPWDSSFLKTVCVCVWGGGGGGSAGTCNGTSIFSCSGKFPLLSHLVFVTCSCLIVLCFNTVFNSISVVSWQPVSQYTYPFFPGVLLTSTPHNILSKPLAAFPHNHCWNNGQQWERNESCRNGCDKSLERRIGWAGERTSDLLFQVLYGTDWAMGP